MSELEMAFVGDTMCGDSFDLIEQGTAAALDKFGNKFLDPQIVDVFSQHDLVFCNVECVFSDIGRKENNLRSLHMRGRANAAEYLANWGVTIANLANNHILEQGREAAIDTVKQLQQRGIRTVGTGARGDFKEGIQVVEISLSDTEIAILGTCFRKEKYAFNGGANKSEILYTIRSLVRNNKIVILSVHWGDELIDRPSIWQRETAREFVDAGACLVIGHHPHVVQGIDDSDSALIAYSLGNFIFDGFLEDTSWSMILSVTISNNTVSKWQAIPILRGKDYRPMLAQNQIKKKLAMEIERRGNLVKEKIIDKSAYKEQYVTELKILETKSRHMLWGSIAKKFFGYRPIYWPQLVLRPIQRRLGLW